MSRTEQILPNQELSRRMAQYYQTSEAYYRELQDVANKEQYSSYLKFIREYAPAGARLLDLGCGLGVTAAYLQEMGFSAVGVDISWKFISYSERLSAQHPGYVCADVLKLPFRDRSFDIVGSFDVLEHIPDAEQFLKEGLRVLKPGGIYVVISPCVLTPFTPLKALFSLKKGHSVYISRTQALRSIFVNLGLILQKKISPRLHFHYRRPVLEETRLGRDEDAVYQSSPIDIKKFLTHNGCRILHYQNYGPSRLHRVVGRLLPDFASTIYIVAQKNDE